MESSCCLSLLLTAHSRGMDGGQLMQNDAQAPTGALGVSPMRWYCLLICCGVSSVQGGYWNTFGSSLKVVHVSDDRLGAYLMHAGQIFIAIPGPVAMGIGPLLAAAWFPSDQRTLATCICTVVNYGGSAAMFVFGPMAVK